MNTPSTEQIQKLPIWAKEYIRDLIRERDQISLTLKRYLDEQTPSGFYYDDMLHQEGKLTIPRRYVQTHQITIVHAGVELEVTASLDEHIRIQWGEAIHRTGTVAFIPMSYQSAHLVSKENMR